MHDADTPAATPHASRIRDAIIDGAVECVRSMGVDRMTVDDVVRTSGISRASIYRHVGSREAIQAAVFRRSNQAFELDAQAILAGPGSFAERLEKVVVWGVGRHAANKDLNHAFVHGLSHATLELCVSIYRESLDQVLRPAFTAAQLSGDMRAALQIPEVIEWFMREMLLLFTQPDIEEAALRRKVQQFLIPVLCRDRAETHQPRHEARHACVQAIAGQVDDVALTVNMLRNEVRRLTHLLE